MENKIEIVGEEENLQLAENEYVEKKKMCSMEGIMKELGKCRAVIALLCFTATVFSGCGNRTGKRRIP